MHDCAYSCNYAQKIRDSLIDRLHNISDISSNSRKKCLRKQVDVKLNRKTIQTEEAAMANAQTADQAYENASDMHELAGKYLTFVLDQEEYGIEILKVREIIKVIEITPVPEAPHYIKGVVNLRGKVIPVADLRLKFDMEEKEHDDATCIIVLDVGGKSMGVVVDTVSEVLQVAGDQIDPTPDFGEGSSNDYIVGVGKIGDTVKMLLNIDQVLLDVDAVSDVCNEETQES